MFTSLSLFFFSATSSLTSTRNYRSSEFYKVFLLYIQQRRLSKRLCLFFLFFIFFFIFAFFFSNLLISFPKVHF